MPSAAQKARYRATRVIKERKRIATFLESANKPKLRVTLGERYDYLMDRIARGAHQFRLRALCEIERATGASPVWRGDKHDGDIRAFAKVGHTGLQISRMLSVPKTWVYQRAVRIGVKFTNSVCDNGHRKRGVTIKHLDYRWCPECLEDAYPGAIARKARKVEAEHYEVVRSSTVLWLGKQLESGVSAYQQGIIKKELASWGDSV